MIIFVAEYSPPFIVSRRNKWSLPDVKVALDVATEPGPDRIKTTPTTWIHRALTWLMTRGQEVRRRHAVQVVIQGIWILSFIKWGG